jgi:hypothetical protein
MQLDFFQEFLEELLAEPGEVSTALVVGIFYQAQLLLDPLPFLQAELAVEALILASEALVDMVALDVEVVAEEEEQQVEPVVEVEMA